MNNYVLLIKEYLIRLTILRICIPLDYMILTIENEHSNNTIPWFIIKVENVTCIFHEIKKKITPIPPSKLFFFSK